MADSIALLRARIAADCAAGEQLKALAESIVRLRAKRSKFFDESRGIRIEFVSAEYGELDDRVEKDISELLEKVIAWCPERTELAEQ